MLSLLTGELDRCHRVTPRRPQWVKVTVRHIAVQLLPGGVRDPSVASSPTAFVSEAYLRSRKRNPSSPEQDECAYGIRAISWWWAHSGACLHFVWFWGVMLT